MLAWSNIYLCKTLFLLCTNLNLSKYSHCSSVVCCWHKRISNSKFFNFPSFAFFHFHCKCLEWRRDRANHDFLIYLPNFCCTQIYIAFFISEPPTEAVSKFRANKGEVKRERETQSKLMIKKCFNFYPQPKCASANYFSVVCSFLVSLARCSLLAIFLALLKWKSFWLYERNSNQTACPVARCCCMYVRYGGSHEKLMNSYK